MDAPTRTAERIRKAALMTDEERRPLLFIAEKLHSPWQHPFDDPDTKKVLRMLIDNVRNQGRAGMLAAAK